MKINGENKVVSHTFRALNRAWHALNLYLCSDAFFPLISQKEHSIRNQVTTCYETVQLLLLNFDHGLGFINISRGACAGLSRT